MIRDLGAICSWDNLKHPFANKLTKKQKWAVFGLSTAAGVILLPIAPLAFGVTLYETAYHLHKKNLKHISDEKLNDSDTKTSRLGTQVGKSERQEEVRAVIPKIDLGELEMPIRNAILELAKLKPVDAESLEAMVEAIVPELDEEIAHRYAFREGKYTGTPKAYKFP